jgi:subfamily B ATP-binding cassette protein MsbA
LLAYLAPYRLHLVLAMVALSLYSGIGLLVPLVIVQLLESVLRERSAEQLNVVIAALGGIFALQAAFDFMYGLTLAYVGEKVTFDLRTKLYRHLHTMSFEFFTEHPVGEIISRFSNDIAQIRTILTNHLGRLLNQGVSLIGSVIIVCMISLPLTLLIVVLLLVLVTIGAAFGHFVQIFSVRVQDTLARATAIVEEVLQGIRVVKSFNRENHEVARYAGAARQTFRAAIRLGALNAGSNALIVFLSFSAVIAILWFGGHEVVAGRMSLPTLAGFLMFGVLIGASLGGLVGLYMQFKEAVGAVTRVFELLTTASPVVDRPNAERLAVVQGRIKFDRVSFSYDGRVSALENVTLDITPGDIVALVGLSGAGKSTIFNLIPRFYDATSGAVYVDGRDVRSLTQRSLREHIGIVPQDTVLFGGSIRSNIAYGRAGASDDEIVAAAIAANAHEFIMELPQQYETVVGERGVKLSGGQRQRIAIARAILKNPRILLLDEATSALDSEAEELVQDALSRLMRGRTTLIIAHRLSTIRNAHRIVVLNNGKIIETVTHDELMRRNGLYAQEYSNSARPAPQPAEKSADRVVQMTS